MQYNDTNAEPLFLARDIAALRQRAERTSGLVGDLLDEANALGWEGRRAEAAVYLRRAEAVLGVLEAIQQCGEGTPPAMAQRPSDGERGEREVRADLAAVEAELDQLFARQQALLGELHQVRALGRSPAVWRRLIDRATAHDEALWERDAVHPWERDALHPAEREHLRRAREISSARLVRWAERLESAERLEEAGR